MLSSRQDGASAALMFYRDAFPWLEATGAARGRADAGVHLIDIQVPTCTWGRYRRGRLVTSVFKAYPSIEEFRTVLAKLLSDRVERLRG